MGDAPITTSQPTAAPAPSAKPRAETKPQPRDSLREISETIVFVVALVLMLKLFVVEAFVIPTGSMAETLYGYQKIVTCPECGFDYPVNSSDEVSPANGRPQLLIGACCPNCRFQVEWDQQNPPPDNVSGDRVLVHKALYEFESPARGDVVVFKYPVDPQVQGELQNYIKRLWGFGGETIAINTGDLYRTTALKYEDTTENGSPIYAKPTSPLNAWFGPEVDTHSKTRPPFQPDGPDYTYHNADRALRDFNTSRKEGFVAPVDQGFELIRKDNTRLEAMKRIVYDNDHQSLYLAKKGVPPRWNFEPNTGWQSELYSGGPENMPITFSHTGSDLGWVRYRHLVPRTQQAWEQLNGGYKPELLPPSVITNFMGYNSGIDEFRRATRATDEFWVGDLILECDADIDAADAEVVMELSKGPHRYQAIFAEGKVKLIRTGPNGQVLASRPSGINGPGTYHLQFANVDCRLGVWVNGAAIDFGNDANYSPDPVPESFDPDDRKEEGWTTANDVLAPASLGAKGNVTFSHLKLWRDTYFTYGDGLPYDGVAKFVDTYYVQPGHYLCLGDNSAQSSDSRKWGTVPERLMLGKAVFVFFPFPPFAPENRLGFIE